MQIIAKSMLKLFEAPTYRPSPKNNKKRKESSTCVE